MFDKLVASEPERADHKSRQGYFVVSSFVVGSLLVTAVVISIFAADFGLGNGGFELTELLAPMADAPEPERPQVQARTSSSLPIRTSDMSRVDEPTLVPASTSSIRNSEVSRPNFPYTIGRFNSDNIAGVNPGRETSTRPAGPGGLDDGLNRNTQVDSETDTPPPARVVKPVARQTLGVINGKATYLPKPIYSAAAQAVKAQGQVNVQVSIDEAGRVTAAAAVSGNPLLRLAAEQAARQARFSITYLSNVPVKVSGVIVYNFVR